jgi:hypothetical protein
MLGRIVAGKDTCADDLLLVVERDEHVARAGVADDAVGVRRSRHEATHPVAVLVLDKQRLVRA